MTKDFKKTIAFIFFILAGITAGAFISYLCRDNRYLNWLSWGQEIGLSTEKPAVVDLIILKFALGFTMKVTIAQIFTVILSIFIYSKSCKSL